MPTYEYRCTKCGHIQEERHSIKKIPKKTKCEKCGEESEKIFSSNVNIIVEDDFFSSNGKY